MQISLILLLIFGCHKSEKCFGYMVTSVKKKFFSKFTAMAHKSTRKVDSRMSQDLKKKETTIVDDVKECGSLQKRPTKKGKIRQFASMPIDTFLKLNKNLMVKRNWMRMKEII
ncbi:uncharacterized protein DS421_20g693690 [Arachis hypogaea]|nr:uncharacterized protein DS421_20g693690 [Arachis hypogaea]